MVGGFESHRLHQSLQGRQPVEAADGLICSVEMLVKSAKIKGRVWRQRWGTNALTVSPPVVVET
jgi:hypothetical protein